MRAVIVLAGVLLGAACSGPQKSGRSSQSEVPDSHIWLEEIQGKEPLAWVEARNKETLSSLEGHPQYKKNTFDARSIVLAKDRLPYIHAMGDFVYNFWQDDHHVRGIWRRTTLARYKTLHPRWETVLDIDKLAKVENENWVYKRSDCLPPKYDRCVVTLSRGGKDASVVREFDLVQKRFVNGGFVLPEAKNDFAWIDRETVVVASDWGPGSLTTSGYPRVVKLWKRGQPLAQATTIFEAQPTDVGLALYTAFSPDGNPTFIQRAITFYESEAFELTAESKLEKLNKPVDAELKDALRGYKVLLLKSPWKSHGQEFKSGDLVALPPGDANAAPQILFSPNDKQSLISVERIQGALLINYLDNIQGKIARAFVKGKNWVMEDLTLPSPGNLEVVSASPFSDLIIYNFESFLTPPTLYATRAGLDTAAKNVKSEKLKQLPARFNAQNFVVEQKWATSADGTQIPYFFIHPKTLKPDGANPVLIYGYGGFEIAQTPYYLATVGKLWLERGGSYVLANIRGGGEFGPRWHQAALKMNRQKAFDDFIAVAEDLVKNKISQPEKIAVSGGSNGGLLVGAVVTQRPDLFGAAVSKVPLLDMLRFNKLLAGASWEAEYGSPDDPKMREYLAHYSPYHNVKSPENRTYPDVFFLTSTLDDRVHPGHARKMVAKMKELGLPVLYFENTEGGHGAAANLQQRVKMLALEYTFLQDQLLRDSK
ncbi:MAG: prolyl oligopeptidase family protein [Bdellovibrionales bacterium]